MEEIERRAERVLDRVPDYVWDGKTLPVPVEQIADSCFGLLVSDMQYLEMAPERLPYPTATTSRGCCFPLDGRSG